MTQRVSPVDASWWVSSLDQSAPGCPGTTLRGVEAVLYFSHWAMGVPPHANFPLVLLSVQTSILSLNLTDTCLLFKWTKFFTEKVLYHWDRLPRELVMTPSQSEFKENLDDTLSRMA